MSKEITTAEGGEKLSVTASKMIASYVNKGAMSDFASVPSYVKLAVLQKFPKAWIKTRQIQGKAVEYIEHTLAKKCLNFAFNFQVDAEIIEKKILEYEQQTSKGKAKVLEALVHVRFTCRNGGEPIKRDIVSTHKAFENTAVPKFDCYKGAISKSWTLLAYSFGMAANVNKEEDEAVGYTENPVKAEPAPHSPSVNKSFDASPAENAGLSVDAPY